MEKLEKRLNNLGKKTRNGLVATGLAGALVLGNGCAAIQKRPNTTGENIWFGAATATAAADIATTQYLFSKGYQEVNPLYGRNPSIERMALVKSAYLGLVYGMGEAFPENRGLLYKIGTIAGAIPTAWNLFQILSAPKENNSSGTGTIKIKVTIPD